MYKLDTILVICFLALFDRTYATCPDGWVAFGGSCYQFGHDKKTFTDAENYCRQHESHLVTIESATEQAFLRSHCAYLKQGPFWIGLTDSDIEGVWKWTSSHETPTYTDWHPGQPNGQLIDNCGALCIEPACNFRWADRPCSLQYSPICELRDTECNAVVG